MSEQLEDVIPRRLLVGVLVATAIACENGAEPNTRTVWIQPIGPTEFSSAPLDTVSVPLTVIVTDQGTRPLEGERVNWSTPDGGTIFPLSEVTDQHGIARATWVLGWRPGTQQARASLPGIDSAASFSAVAEGFRASGIGSGDADHMCAIDLAGALFCWGRNTEGEVGDGSLTPTEVPRPVMLAEAVAQVVLGSGFTCARTQAGEVYCWGLGNAGQLGNGTLASSPTPAPVALPGPAKLITARSWGACAIGVSGEAYCWGYNDEGQLGIGTRNDTVPTPAQVLGGFLWRDLRLGDDRACGVREGGQVYCWGDPGVPLQLGTGVDTSTTSPLPVTNAPPADSVGLSGHIQCSIAATGLTHCWGNNWSIGVEDPRESIPDPIPLATPFRSIHSLHRPVVALGTDGLGYWWGPRPGATASDQQTPAPFSGELQLTTIGAGGPGVCGIEATTSTVYCWSWDGYPGLTMTSVPPPAEAQGSRR